MKKSTNVAKTYALGSQGILTMVMFLFLGLYIGYKIDPNSVWPGVLACIGVIVGVIVFVSYLLIILKGEKENGQKPKD